MKIMVKRTTRTFQMSSMNQERGDTMKIHKAVVTGGAGFIGSHLVERLVASGIDVTVIDNFQAGKKANLSSVAERITVVEGDVRDSTVVNQGIADTDVVFHLAANASVPYSVENPRYDFETNAVGTFNVLEAARHTDVQKVVYASSAAVYGEPVYTPIDERHPVNPVSPYGVSKLAGEMYGTTFNTMYGLTFSALRIFNTYGPRQPRYVMYDLLEKLRETPRSLEVLGTGAQIRDYCYVSDMVNALTLAAQKGEGVYNAASGSPTSIREVAEFIVAHVSPGAAITYTGTSWKGDITTLTADITHLKTIGFAPKVSLPEGIKKMIQWFDKSPH
jgi:UDP-glucose 4-epimerase